MLVGYFTALKKCPFLELGTKHPWKELMYFQNNNTTTSIPCNEL
jgi:hypothetical protein